MKDWVLSKIKTYLNQREGFSIEGTEVQGDIARTVIQDALGFRYEVQVKVLGRIQDDDSGANDRFSGLVKRMSFNSSMEIKNETKKGS